MIEQIVSKVILILLFSMIIKGLELSGFLEVLLRPLGRLKKTSTCVIYWFFIGFFVSGFFNDMATAAILFPMLIYFIEHNNIVENRTLLLVATVFGIVTGGDLTLFGGNDNILALGYLEQSLGTTLAPIDWTKMMIVPTMITAAIVLAVLWFFANKNEIRSGSGEVVVSTALPTSTKVINVITTIMLLGAIYCGFQKMILVAYILLAISLVMLRVNTDFFKKLPYKALLIWTCCYVIGTFIQKFILSFNFSFGGEITFITIALLIIIPALVTNFSTNTATAAALIPVVLSLFPGNVLVFTILCKVINLSYITVYGNSCLAVASGYGLKQRELAKFGVPVVILAMIGYLIYFCAIGL